MCMKRNEIIWLAYAALMALALAGTYVLGDDSWMAYLLCIPAFLVLKAMATPQGPASNHAGPANDGRQPIR